MFLLSILVGFPAGAVGLFIHWRWQPTGAGDLFFMDRRRPSDAEAAAGRPRPRAATLGHAAVRASGIAPSSTISVTLARAREAPRRRFQIAVSFFMYQRRDAELGGGCRRPPAPPRRRRGSGVFLLSILVGFPAGAVGLFIHWRWQSDRRRATLFFMDRRWPSDAEAAAGRPRPRRRHFGSRCCARSGFPLARPSPLPFARGAEAAQAPIP